MPRSGHEGRAALWPQMSDKAEFWQEERRSELHVNDLKERSRTLSSPFPLAFSPLLTAPPPHIMTRRSPPPLLPLSPSLLSCFLFVPSATPPPLPFHCFMERGCHSSTKATNGRRKTLSGGYCGGALCFALYSFGRPLNLDISLGSQSERRRSQFASPCGGIANICFPGPS